MKKILAILMCSLSILFVVACNKSDKVKNGHYAVKGQENLTDPTAEFGKRRIIIDDNKFNVFLNLTCDLPYECDYEIKDGKVYATDKDSNKFVFKINGDNLIFEESEILEQYEKKGTEFVITEEYK